MNKVSPLTARPLQIVVGGCLAVLWVLFAVAHFAGFQHSGRVSLLVFGVAESLIAAFFLLRSRPQSQSSNPIEWTVSVVGTFFPFIFRPTAEVPLPVTEWGIIVGSTLQIAGVLSLNRSFALVPALRELKTTGMYRIVRHPIYLGYLISYFSYALGNFSLTNLLAAFVTASFLAARIYFEERHLATTAEYRAYQQRIRWRLVPFVF